MKFRWCWEVHCIILGVFFWPEALDLIQGEYCGGDVPHGGDNSSFGHSTHLVTGMLPYSSSLFCPCWWPFGNCSWDWNYFMSLSLQWVTLLYFYHWQIKFFCPAAVIRTLSFLLVKGEKRWLRISLLSPSFSYWNKIFTTFPFVSVT